MLLWDDSNWLLMARRPCGPHRFAFLGLAQALQMPAHTYLSTESIYRFAVGGVDLHSFANNKANNNTPDQASKLTAQALH